MTNANVLASELFLILSQTLSNGSLMCKLGAPKNRELRGQVLTCVSSAAHLLCNLSRDNVLFWPFLSRERRRRNHRLKGIWQTEI